MTKPLFSGLIVDENDNIVETYVVGDESCNVVNDSGFRRHIPTEQVDRQVLALMKEQISGHEDLLGEQAAKMLGQEDLFSRAIIDNQIKNIDKQFGQLLEKGIPEDGRAYMGMMGFKIVINFHGEVVHLSQPGTVSDEGEE